MCEYTIFIFLPVVDITVIWFERIGRLELESLLRESETPLVLVDHGKAWIPVCKNIQIDPAKGN